MTTSYDEDEDEPQYETPEGFHWTGVLTRKAGAKFKVYDAYWSNLGKHALNRRWTGEIRGWPYAFITFAFPTHAEAARKYPIEATLAVTRYNREDRVLKVIEEIEAPNTVAGLTELFAWLGAAHAAFQQKMMTFECYEPVKFGGTDLTNGDKVTALRTSGEEFSVWAKSEYSVLDAADFLKLCQHLTQLGVKLMTPRNPDTLIRAHDIISASAFPSDAGAKLAEGLIQRLEMSEWKTLEIDLRHLPAGMLIGTFFFHYLGKVNEWKPELLDTARKTRWLVNFPFQKELIDEWMAFYKPPG